MKKLIKAMVLVISLLNFAHLFSMQQPNQQGNIIRTIEGITYTYEPQENVFSCVIERTRYVLRHPNLHDQQFYVVSVATGERIAFPVGTDLVGLMNRLMARLEEFQRPEAPAVAPQRSLVETARNFFLRWGLPIRFDVGLREAIRDEGHRFMTAWNRPALRSMFIFLGEITVFCVLLQSSGSLGSYSSHVYQLGQSLSPYNRVNPKYAYPTLRRIEVAGENLMGVCMMPLIYSYVAYFGLHAAEDFFCLIGAMVCANWQAVFNGRDEHQGNARQ